MAQCWSVNFEVLWGPTGFWILGCAGSFTLPSFPVVVFVRDMVWKQVQNWTQHPAQQETKRGENINITRLINWSRWLHRVFVVSFNVVPSPSSCHSKDVVVFCWVLPCLGPVIYQQRFPSWPNNSSLIAALAAPRDLCFLLSQSNYLVKENFWLSWGQWPRVQENLAPR